jgi:hypothetical protein
MTSSFLSPAAFGLLVLFPVALSAAGGPEPVPGLSISTRAFGVADADLDPSDASYAVSGSTVEVGWAHWQAGVTRQFYQWDNPGAFPGLTGPDDPWEFLTRIQLGFQHTHTLTDRWSVDTLAGVLSDFEEELDDSWAAYLGGYGTYRAGEDWLWFVGLLYSHHAEVASDFEWVPVLGLAWRPGATEGLSFRLGLPATRARWHFSPRTRLVLDLNTLEGGVYRLADDSPLLPGGYVEMVNASLSLSLEHRLTNTLELSAGIGHSLHRELKLYDPDGKETDQIDVDPAPSLHLALRASF